ncbi:hypothetical protein P171DRAFT_437946 [Karstenula rhodostoma CBS 690.94]|uniref:Uncharacterized protein n=1 Tax=Karstenula rhodostoma CBS 690.94 TaxID=1392251 RepID=A0A9P4UIZ9_9PLEO|nr:hypothetical protein P171DRAFT_437946 [Karstenula rhodostoma CBS 690.94]
MPISIPDAVSTLATIFGPKPIGTITKDLKYITTCFKVDGADSVSVNSAALSGYISPFLNSDPNPVEQLFRSTVSYHLEIHSISIPLNPIILVLGTAALAGVNYLGSFTNVMDKNSSIVQRVLLRFTVLFSMTC